ncbi:enterotoxin A family protein [Vibrio vulnificus]|uniref:enterotoxin A family protein n=1 Tax=Vibrio vulnificus TaxID=672 RepID=UPI001CDBA855|nr:enterotoxin A family protein [Vibrio vulnificus]MCA3966640.1 NAD(+)--arginine ADP-ribosyltransferase [Vibrio vulnificus]
MKIIESIHKYFIVVSILISFSCIGGPSEFYRADSRNPEEIKKSKGLYPKGQDEFFEHNRPMDISLFSHAQGTQTGYVRYDDGYVSTSSSLRSAHLIGQSILSGFSSYFIYVIAPAPNLMDVNRILGHYSPHPEENEFAALGGIPWSQVIGWYVVNSGVIGNNIIRNRDYRRDLYSNLVPASPENAYQFSGFPSGHLAWRQEPWINFAPVGCDNVTKGKESSCLKTQSENAYLYLQNIKTIIGLKKEVKYINNITSPNLTFPKHDYIYRWVNLDNSDNTSLCGFNLDANNDNKYITCLRNIGGFNFKNEFIYLDDYGWYHGQDFVDANGDGITDFCRLQYTWTKPVCSLSTLNSAFSLNNEGKYVNGGYNHTRYWTKNSKDNKSKFCREISGTEILCSSISGSESNFTDSDLGWNDSKIWLDIDANGEEDFCRLVGVYTKLRCNLNKGHGWKVVESIYTDGGYSNLRFSIKMSYNKDNYCVIIDDYNKLNCIEVNDNDEIEYNTINIPIEITSKSGIEFNDIDGDGRDDLCNYDNSKNEVKCYLNENKKFSDDYVSIPLSRTPISNLGVSSMKIVGLKESESMNSAVCYNVGYGSMNCDVFKVY